MQIQQLIERCVTEDRLPTDFEVTAEALRTFALLRENCGSLREAGPLEGRAKGLAVVDGFDLADARSCRWADGLVIHRFGDHLPPSTSDALRERLDERLHMVSERLAFDPDHPDVLEWLLASTDRVDPVLS